jgi:hypothetical protein
MPSIVDGTIRRGGAWTVTRGLLSLLRGALADPEIVTVVPSEPRWRLGRQAACLLGATMSHLPAKVRFARSHRLRRRLRQLLTGPRFDLLVINGSDLLWCLDDTPPSVPTLAVVHNCESNLYRDQVLATTPRALRRLLLADCARLDRFETEGLRRVQAAMFLSTSDAATFASRIPGLPHLVVPPLFTHPPERIAKEGSPDILDLGLLANFTWWPNRDGLRWLQRDVLQRLPGNIRVHLFGQFATEVAPADARIVAHSFVDDLRTIWRTCDWMIVPTRFGSGVSVKTAESLYHGMPLLSTPFGMRGLPAFEHPQIVVRDNADDWVSFLSSPEARILSRSRLSNAISDYFSVLTYRDPFRNLLADLHA